MKLKVPLAVGIFCIASVSFYSIARAQMREEHHEEQKGEHHEEHARPPAARPVPPKFEAHPQGVHPKGAQFHSHPVRVLAPRAVVRGHHEFRHWEHPEFVRPSYYWNWTVIHQVSCTAEDSYGDQYPVTENWIPGWGLDNMTSVEDDAVDRCYQESGGDSSCYLATCSHY